MAEPTITFDEGTGVTVIEVATADRVGLAFSLASALAELDCTIVKATLSTLGPNAVDTFGVGGNWRPAGRSTAWRRCARRFSMRP